MTEMAILTVDGVGLDTAKGRSLLCDVSFSVTAGEVFGIVGPNGAGKTTLLRCLSKAVSPARGAIGVCGHDLGQMPARMLAQLVAMVPQESPSGPFLLVQDMVALGRLPHLGAFQTLTRRDKAVVADAMASMDVETLADRRISSLSGGERQRVMVARAIAQETEILILDEPGNHLDVRHRLDLMRRVCGMGKTVILTLHDLESAARDCSRLLLLEHGRVAACGPAASVLTPRLIRRVFQVESEVLADPRQGAPWLAFYLPRDSRPEEPA